MQLLGVSGSLRRGSYNSALLRAVAAECPGVALVVWRGLAGIPAFDEDCESTPPPAVGGLRDAIARSDAVLIATPEYNASVPGALKNALDWVSRPWAENVLRNKPVAVAGVSQGVFGGVWAQAELRKILATIGARVLDVELSLARAQEAFAADGSLQDARVAARLREIVAGLAEVVQQRAA
jgi:chromate reductase, NAD(P)H dehydrogenase (quinone)